MPTPPHPRADGLVLVHRGIERSERVGIGHPEHLTGPVGEEAVASAAQVHEVFPQFGTLGQRGVQIRIDQDRPGAGRDPVSAVAKAENRRV